MKSLNPGLKIPTPNRTIYDPLQKLKVKVEYIPQLQGIPMKARGEHSTFDLQISKFC